MMNLLARQPVCLIWIAGGAISLANASPAPQVPLAPSVPTNPSSYHLYQPIILRFNTGVLNPSTGALFSEQDLSPNNPWFDYRMTVVFTAPDGATFEVPGFYAGNGFRQPSGSTWRCHFSPREQPGAWSYTATLDYEPGINVRDKGYVDPTPQVVFTQSGTLPVSGVDTTAPGFYSRGFLTAPSIGRYLEFDEGGQFVMAGVGGPENFLAYAEFTGYGIGMGGMAGTACPASPGNPGNQNGGSSWGTVGTRLIHRYLDHVGDFDDMSDPSWGPSPGLGRGIIGALDYMASVGMNGLYFMPMNLGGDSRDAYPFSDPGTNACIPTPASTVFHYSAPRMHEWNIVFQHAQTKGLLLNFVLAEREQPNIDWLGGSNATGGVAMSDERKLYLKNLVAMFAHNPGVKWNLCEENRAQASPAEKGQFSATELRDLGQWINAWDEYDHPISVHTDPNDTGIYSEILALAGSGDDWLTNTSLQIHGEGSSSVDNYGDIVQSVRQLFTSRPRSVVVDMDENGSAQNGAGPNNATGDAAPDEVRKRALWDVYFGGANLMWYFGNRTTSNGGGDHNLENFRSRSDLFEDTDIARRFVASLDILNFGPLDDAVMGACPCGYGKPRVFTKMDSTTFVYYGELFDNSSNYSPGSVDLTQLTSGPATFKSYWFDPSSEAVYGPTTIGIPMSSAHVPPQPANTVQGDDRIYILYVE